VADVTRHFANVAAPLRHRNYRLFYIGQLISLIGSWMQTVGQSWLVLGLTHSPFLLGVINALQWTPVLLFSLPAGFVADRFPRRTVIVVTQSVSLVLALSLGILAVGGWVQFWHVAVLAALLGTVNAVDVPTRQAFLVEMVGGTEDLTGAIALNSSLFNGARLIGPAIAGLVIAAGGVGAAFLANAASYLAVIWALAAMEVTVSAEVGPAAGLFTHIAEGVRFVRRTPSLLRLLAVVTVLSLFPLNSQLFVPVLARFRLHLEPSGFGFLLSAQGAGALLAALFVAATSGDGPRRAYLLWGGVLLCGAILALSAVTRVELAAIVLFLAGAGMITFLATANSTVQMTTPDALRGRITSIYTMVNNGTTPIGSLVMGGLIDAWGLTAGLLIAGAAGLAGVLGIGGTFRPTDCPTGRIDSREVASWR